MTDDREIIEMLKILKEQSFKSHNDTAVLEVSIDSFNFVLDKAIKSLEARENKVKKAREEIENEIKFWSEPSKYNVKPIDAIKNAKVQSYKHCLEILDKLIESEENNG